MEPYAVIDLSCMMERYASKEGYCPNLISVQVPYVLFTGKCMQELSTLFSR